MTPCLVSLIPPSRIRHHIISRDGRNWGLIIFVRGLDGIEREVERRIGLTGAQVEAVRRQSPSYGAPT